MKKALSLISILLIIAMFAACQTNKDELSKNDLPDILDATNEKTEAQSTKEQKTEELPTEAQPIEKEPVKYVMYADYAASVGENSSIDAERSDIEMKPTAEKNFNIIKREYVNDPIVDSTNTKKFKILNETYDVSYVRSYNTTLVSSGNSGAFHMYYSDSGSIAIEARDGTNEIVYFSNSRVSRREDGNFSIEQAEAKAKQVVESLYGRESLEDYSFEIELIEGNNNEKYYSAQYHRYVYGFKTEDNITVKLNMNGELAAVVSFERGIMSTAEQDLTKEEIENAIKAVNENFSSSWNISSDHYIVIDSNGDYYLRSNLARNRDKFPFAMQIFTNIQ